MLDIDEKAFIISKMLSGHKKQSHNCALKDHVKKLIGGLSEQDSLKIMQTNPYMQTTPTALSLGNNIIDYSNTDIALHSSLSKRARTKTPINSLFVDATRKFPLGDVPRLESEPELLVDFSGFTQATDQSLWEKGEKYEKKGGRQKRVNKPLSIESKAKRIQMGSQALGVWQEFYSKCSSWKTFDNMKGNKRKAISLLYQHVKKNGFGDVDAIKGNRFASFEEFAQYLHR